MNLAPICLSTYKRHQHLTETLDALASNTLAKESELFICSDAAKPGDEQDVCKVRSLISKVTGFKRVHVIERTENNRVANNRGGMNSLLNQFEKMIFLEEDVVTAPLFLDFLNEGLNYFESDKSVFGICAYTPPINLSRFSKENAFLCPRFSAWGFGTWQDRYSQIALNKVSIRDLTFGQKRRLYSAGADLVKMLESLSTGKIEALDVRINFTMAKNYQKVVYPITSLSNNKGHDGTGIHCGVTDYFETTLETRSKVEWNFKDLRFNHALNRELFLYRSRYKSNFISNMAYNLTQKVAYEK